MEWWWDQDLQQQDHDAFVDSELEREWEESGLPADFEIPAPEEVTEIQPVRKPARTEGNKPKKEKVA